MAALVGVVTAITVFVLLYLASNLMFVVAGVPLAGMVELQIGALIAAGAGVAAGLVYWNRRAVRKR